MSESNAPKSASDFIDLGKIFSECIKKWYIILGSIVFCLLLAFVYNRKHPDEYKVKASILISQDDGGLPGAGGLSSLFGSQAYVEDEVFAVQSHTVYRNAAKRLGFNITYYEKTGFLRSRLCYNDEPVELITPPGISDTLSTTISFRVKASKEGKVNVKVKANKQWLAKIKDAKFPVTVKTDYGTFILKKTDNYPADKKVVTGIYLQSYDRVAEVLTADILVDKASRKSNIIYMETTSSNPEYTKALFNCIFDEYNSRDLNEKNSHSEKTLAFLDERLAMMSDDLARTERLISEFKSKNNIPDLVSEATYQYTLRGELDEALTKAETESAVVNMLTEFISDPRNADTPVPGSYLFGAEGATAAALSKYNERMVYRQKLASNVSPDNRALVDLDRELQSRRENLLSTLEQTSKAMNLRLSELRGKYGTNLSALSSVPQKELEYRDIERQRKIKEQLYVFLLKQREERSLILANGQNKGLIVDEAYSSTEPAGLSSKVIYVIAFVLGFMLSMFIIYLMSIFRNKFATREELEEVTDVPMLGEVCTDRTGRTLVVRADTSNPTAELFRLIRSNLQFILRSADDKVILMTSTRSGEGKSYISINLAASLALLNKKVLLVGADVRNPKLAEYLDLPHGMGLTEYLSSDQLPLDRIIRRNPLGNGVDIITSGPIPPNPSELLSGTRIEDFMEQLRGMYDYIIIDSAPVGMVSDTFAIGRLADATVYVCRANYTSRADVKFFNEVYASERLPKMALVVNGTTAKKGYGYGYGASADNK